jgi:hypothetical protein
VGLIDSLFAEYEFAYVFHLAAYAAEGLSHFIKRGSAASCSLPPLPCMAKIRFP